MKCLFYLPYKLDEHGRGARMLRPRKMLEAFREIGYEVYAIEGDSATRRRLIRDAKHRVSSGERFDFMYSESHTMPTLLTDAHHLPTHPFMDFGFFSFVKRHGIAIGLFYPDIYWKFDNYAPDLPAWKRVGALLNYRYDIAQYERLLSKFYVSDMKVCDYLGVDRLSQIASELPPGAENLRVSRPPYTERDFRCDPLEIFYVGGLGNQYQIAELIRAVSEVEQTKLTICCRELEWQKELPSLERYLCDRVIVIHKTSDELEPYYAKADLCSLMFKPDIYIEMAKPFKAYEYLAHEIPVLSTKGTAIGDFVETNAIGWNIEYSADTIAGIMRAILDCPDLLAEKANNCRLVKSGSLWTSRASQVVSDLVV
jgi:glycosyltransferase involved in cell wall biosynthesis